MRGRKAVISTYAMIIFTMKILFLISALILSVHAIAQQGPTIAFDAALVVENDVEIKTRLTGIIDKIYVDRGAWVKKGQPLAELDNRDLKLEMKKAGVHLQELKAEYERAKSLHEQKLLSDSEYDARRLSFRSEERR